MAKVNFTKGKQSGLAGIPELAESLDDIMSELNSERASKVLMKAAIVCRDQAKRNAPVDSGLLQESIRVAYGKKRRRKANDEELNVIVTVKRGKGGASHAQLIELGTSKMPAQPFLRPAVRQTRKEMTQIIADGIKDILENQE